MGRKKKLLKTTESDTTLNDSNEQLEPIRIIQVEVGDSDITTSSQIVNEVKETIDSTYRELGKQPNNIYVEVRNGIGEIKVTEL